MLKQYQRSLGATIANIRYLEEAIRHVKGIVSVINSSIVKRDKDTQLLQLANSFNSCPLLSDECPGRELVRCDELYKLCHNGLKSEHEQLDKLTNDVLLFWFMYIQRFISFFALMSSSMEKAFQVDGIRYFF